MCHCAAGLGASAGVHTTNRMYASLITACIVLTNCQWRVAGWHLDHGLRGGIGFSALYECNPIMQSNAYTSA